MACCEYLPDMRNVVFCWGNTYNGELGLGGNEEVTIASPCRWTNFVANVCDIACGKSHTVVLLNDGLVYSCGKNDVGQLGHTETERKLDQVKAIQVHFINQIKCGSDHTLALSEAGQVFAWGSNNYGQLGLGCDDNIVPVPRIIKSLIMFTVIQITCGAYHSMALTTTGELYSWGFNTYGQLGIGTAENCNKPWLVASLTGIPIAHIAAGGCHSFALTTSGGIFSWGKNKFGQLGLNDEKDHWFPTSQKTLHSQHVKYVSCGEDYTSCLTQEGGVFTFGAGMYGQLGHSSKSNEILPRKVIELMGSVVIQIACGRCHTIVYVPSGNRVYTFGLGGSGQLGTGNLNSSTTPLLLPEFCWDEQNQACSPSNEERTLRNVRSRSPLEVKETNSRLSHLISSYRTQLYTRRHKRRRKTRSPKKRGKDQVDGSMQLQVFKIINGGDQSFALMTYAEDNIPPQDFRIYDKRFQITVLEVENLKEIMKINATDCVPQELMSYIETVFSSSACINGSFLKPKESYNCSSKNHGIDMNAAATGFSYIEQAKNSSIPDLVEHCLSIDLLPKLSPEPPDAEVLRLYLTLPLCHLFKDNKRYIESIICPFAQALLHLNQRAAKFIDIWWSQLGVQYFRSLLQIYKSSIISLLESFEALPSVNIYKSSVISMLESFEAVPRINNSVKRKYLHLCLGVMKKLNKVNIENREIVPYQEFYISEVTEKIDIRHDYAVWLRTPCKGDSLFFCDYPFVFDAPAKTLILQADSAMQMQSAMNSAFQQNFIGTFAPIVPANPFLLLIVTRDNIVQDTINQLAKHDQSDLKKPLKVIFHGEDAVDAGGVRKEFFLLLLREALDPKYGMFTEYPETRCIWFHAKTFQEDDQMFYLIGILCGLAIYNFTIIDLPFPLVLYKKLLNEKVQLEDLQELSPPVAKGLQNLLDYEGDDVEEVFVLNFEISLEVYGSMVSFELKPGGRDIAVNKENREEYVRQYVDFVLNSSISDAFRAFSQGFHKVCGGRVLELFHAQELMTLVIGNEEYDWEELEKNAEYKNEYDAGHPAIKKFWKVFHKLTLEQKKKFLLFLTGSDRIPILGMKSVKIIFQPMHVTDDYLPVAHTCFNILDLPHYTTEEVLHAKLLQAIENTQGFGLA